MQDWNEVLRKACERDKRTTYAIARDSGLAVAPLSRFIAGTQTITLTSAMKLADTLGYRLTKGK
ncbi:MAG TPA: hypothetical protein PK093_03025 [Phycisphaerae bacterium]|nr:hypothetical protein [Phycisphaerae bacterium]